MIQAKDVTRITGEGVNHLKPQLTAQIPSIPQQEGSTDCGVFAIAYVYHAANNDPFSQILPHMVQNPRIEHDQANVIRYAAAYVPFKLLKQYRQKTSPESQAIVDCLSDMDVNTSLILTTRDDTGFLAYRSEWIKKKSTEVVFFM